jgi:hypothetical protein
MGNPSGRVVEGMGLQPLACWNCGFQFREGHECLSVVNVVCCQVDVCVTGQSLIQRNPDELLCVTECDQEQQ